MAFFFLYCRYEPSQFARRYDPFSYGASQLRFTGISLSFFFFFSKRERTLRTSCSFANIKKPGICSFIYVTPIVQGGKKDIDRVVSPNTCS